MTVECEDCANARVRTWGGYRAGCDGCAARGAARSLAAFNALDPKGSGDPDALRMLEQRMLPKLEFKEARRMVWQWWQEDHEGTVNAA